VCNKSFGGGHLFSADDLLGGNNGFHYDVNVSDARDAYS